jgi:hypothetical protein
MKAKYFFWNKLCVICWRMTWDRAVSSIDVKVPCRRNIGTLINQGEVPMKILWLLGFEEPYGVALIQWLVFVGGLGIKSLVGGLL